MNGCHCCETGTPPAGSKINSSTVIARNASRPTFLRKCMHTARWILPGTILALLPKCPICFAAYVALGTGIGLSVTAATYLRTGLLALCLGSLCYLVINRVSVKRDNGFKLASPAQPVVYHLNWPTMAGTAVLWLLYLIVRV